MQASSHFSEAEQWRLIAAGDESAFTALYRERQGGIYRFAWQMSGSATIAEDVTQEVFMALIRETHNFDPSRGTLAAYLYGIARHQVLRRLEKDRPLLLVLSHADEADESRANIERREAGTSAGNDPLENLSRHELVASVRQAVLALPEHYREVIVLCEFHELSYAEAACVLDCAVGTVRSRLHRARGILAERLRGLRAMEEAKEDAPPQQARATRCLV